MFIVLHEKLRLNNPNFNSVEAHGIKINEVPYNRFTMTSNRWENTHVAKKYLTCVK